MAEMAVAAGIGAGGNLIGGLIGANASAEASRLAAAGVRRGQDLNAMAFKQTRDDLGMQRRFNAAALDRIAGQFGLPTMGYEEAGFDISPRTESGLGLSRDPYDDPNRRRYTDVAKGYLSGLQPISDRVAGISDMYAGPDWMNNLRDSFKTSPGYEFTRDEASRAFNQSARGNIMGGGRAAGGARLASGLAAGQWPSFLESTMAGSKLGLVGSQQQADLLGMGYNMETGAMGKESDLYTNYFNRLLSSAGLSNAATTAGVQANMEFGGNAAKLAQNLGAAEARGPIGTGQAFSDAARGATSFLSNPALWGSSNNSSSSGISNSVNAFNSAGSAGLYTDPMTGLGAFA